MAMNYKMGVEVDLEVENFKKKAKEAQDSITQLEKELINLRKEKLSLSDKGELEKNKASIQQTTIALKEQRIALRETNVQLKERVQALKTAGTAQQQFRSQVGASNAVALEFNRIIQDAPFGIIGVGNNIQQLATQFQALKGPGVTTGQALKQSLLSIVSPSNLVVLGISAITAAFTAYQLGAFDSVEQTDKLKESLDEYEQSLKSVAKASLEGAKNAQDEIAQLKGLELQATNTALSQEKRTKAALELQQLYPQYFSNLTTEQIKNGEVADAYQKVINLLIAKAKAQAAVNQIAENGIEIMIIESKLEQLRAKRLLETADAQAQIDNLIRKRQQEGFLTQGDIDRYAELVRRLNEANDSLEEEQTLSDQIASIRIENIKLEDEINKRLREGADLVKDQKTNVKELVDELKNLSNEYDQKIKLEIESEFSAANFTKNLEKIFKTDPETKFVEVPVNIDFQPSEIIKFEPGLIESIKNQIESLTKARDVATDPARILAYNEQIKVLQAQIDLFNGANDSLRKSNQLLIDSFAQLGIGIANSLNISNNALRGFVSTLLSNTPKIIQAILAQSRINKQASKANVQASAQEAAADGIVIGTKAAKALGPVGLALLPVFVGGALALISSAFRGTGGRVNTSAGGSTAKSAFASNAVGSSITGFGSTANPFGDLTLRTSIRGTDIELLLERVNTKSRA